LLNNVLRRKNVDLYEALEQLDSRYVEAGKDARKAWVLLSEVELCFVVGEINRCLRNPRYYLENYHFIRAKGALIQPLWPFWDSQELFLESFMRQFNASEPVRIVVLKARQLGVCLDPSTRVLTTDLQWVPIGELKVGQELVAVDEFSRKGRGNARRMRDASVRGVLEVYREAYRITLDDGRSIICTPQHPWLSRGKSSSETKWRCIDGSRTKNKKLKIGTEIRWVTKPWDEPTLEDGWFGGILDGEGSISNENRSGVSVSVSQVEGLVLDRIMEYVHSHGYNWRIEDDKPERKSKFGSRPVPKIAIGRTDEIFKLIGQTRPTRFIGKRFWVDRELPGKKTGIGWSKIVNIEYLGKRRMIDLQTSTGTYIAEGFVSHNTTISVALMDWLVFLHPNVHALSMSDEEDRVDVNFSMARTAWANLPWWLQPEKRYDVRGQLLGFDRVKDFDRARDPGMQSLLYFESANQSSGAAYSKSLYGAHLAEVARYRNSNSITEGIFGSLVNYKHSIGIMESTARGRHSTWHRVCQSSQKKTLKWDFVFMEWFREPGYSISVPEGFVRTQEEEAIVKKCSETLSFHLTDDQLSWRREKMAEFEATDGDPEKFHQEFPLTPAEAFVASGRCAFSKKRLNDMITHFCRPPRWKGNIRLDEDNLTPRLSPNPAEGCLQIWEWPKSNAVYYIAGDPSMGIDTGDPACAQILAIPEDINQPLRQVGRWHGWAPPTQFARILAALGYLYNIAEVAPECNTITTVASDLVKVLLYPKWYRWMREDKARNAYSNWIGWQTTFRNKNELIGRYREALDQWTVIIRCEDDIDEMFDFVEEEEGTERYSARAGAHDDCVMTHMICFYCATQLRPRTGYEIDEKPAPTDYQNTEYSPIYDKEQATAGSDPDFYML
jgi:hypothetical protein